MSDLVNERPRWFDDATRVVLDGSDALLAAQTPRQVEESTAALLGGEMHRALNAGIGLRFGWWFVEVLDAAATRVRTGLERGDDSWRAPLRLLYGMAAIAPTDRAQAARSALAEARSLADTTGGSSPEPAWLTRVLEIEATGDMWHMRDAYGGRRALIAGLTYPQSGERCAYLFDIDVCGLVTLTHAGVHDDEHEAAGAWRTLAGESARGAVLDSVRTPDELQCLVYVDVGGEYLQGAETRSVMDNWFRARRRIEDVAAAARRRGMPLPPDRSLFHDVSIDAAVEEFTKWHCERHGVEPDSLATDAIAVQWLEGTLPDARHVATPHRAEYQLALMSDWPIDSVTISARTLLPEWIRWNGERSGLAEPLTTAAVAVACRQRPRAATDCPDAP